MRRRGVIALVGLTLTFVLLTLGRASADNRVVPELPPTTSTVYFLADDRAAPIGVRRSLERRSPYAREALLALLAGPTGEERRVGITSAIPPRTEIRSMSFRGYGGTGAVVDLSGLPATGDVVERARIVT
ncbi:MAG: GerMN domain-containing protein, partial [Gaiellaceae bacterium]